MNTTTLRELVIGIVLIVLMVLAVNPFHLWMPNMAQMALVTAALAVFAAFAAFVLRERALDEREALHRTLAGRNAFLAGAAVLVAGIVAGAFRDQVDPWLVAALAVSIIVKLATRVYTDLRQ